MEINNKPTTCKKYIWSELTAGRSVTHLSVLHAIGSIKCQQRIFDLRRDLERKHRRERRNEQEADTLERREAELKHGKAMRQVDRERVRISLSEAIRLWKEEEEAEAAKLREEIEEAKRKEAEGARQKDTE